MQVKDVMSKHPEYILATCSIAEAAQKMRQLDTGFLPIGDKKTDKLIGAITDRDITLSAIANGNALSEPVSKIMHSGIHYCFENDEIEAAAKCMTDKQIRRLVVLNKDKRLSGILSLGDIALRCMDEHLAGKALKHISKH